jgi:hypothetical protein
MKTAAFVIASLFVLAAYSQTRETVALESGGRVDQTSQAAAATDGTSGNEPISIPAAELEWVDLDPDGVPGVQLAALWGDPPNGAFGAFFRLPAGFAAPLHRHTNPMKLVIVSGTYIQQPEGKPAFRLGPGSYLMQPGGDYRHTTSCDAGSDCIFFVESEGAFDLFVVEDSPDPR